MTALPLCLTNHIYTTYTDVQSVDVRNVVRISMPADHGSIMTYVNLALEGTFRDLFDLPPADCVCIISRSQISTLT